MRFLLQHRCAAITSHVPPSGERGSVGTRLGTFGIYAGLRGLWGRGEGRETRGRGPVRCGHYRVLSPSPCSMDEAPRSQGVCKAARKAHVMLEKTTGATALSSKAAKPRRTAPGRVCPEAGAGASQVPGANTVRGRQLVPGHWLWGAPSCVIFTLTEGLCTPTDDKQLPPPQPAHSLGGQPEVLTEGPFPHPEPSGGDRMSGEHGYVL